MEAYNNFEIIELIGFFLLVTSLIYSREVVMNSACML